MCQIRQKALIVPGKCHLIYQLAPKFKSISRSRATDGTDGPNFGSCQAGRRGKRGSSCYLVSVTNSRDHLGTNCGNLFCITHSIAPVHSVPTKIK